VEAVEDGERRSGRGAPAFESAFGALRGTYPPGSSTPKTSSAQSFASTTPARGVSAHRDERKRKRRWATAG
jgi:hypothetical protein